jgi:hypothetical protein
MTGASDARFMKVLLCIAVYSSTGKLFRGDTGGAAAAAAGP